jgi:hypothetical protein
MIIRKIRCAEQYMHRKGQRWLTGGTFLRRL